MNHDESVIPQIGRDLLLHLGMKVEGLPPGTLKKRSFWSRSISLFLFLWDSDPSVTKTINVSGLEPTKVDQCGGISFQAFTLWWWLRSLMIEHGRSIVVSFPSKMVIFSVVTLIHQRVTHCNQLLNAEISLMLWTSEATVSTLWVLCGGT